MNPETEKLRQQLATTMATHCSTADAVLRGDAEWSATQARLFVSLLNKLVPDAKQGEARSAADLSIAELRNVIESSETADLSTPPH